MRRGRMAPHRIRSACNRMCASSDSDVNVTTSRVTSPLSKASPMTAPSVMPRQALVALGAADRMTCVLITLEPLPCRDSVQPSVPSAAGGRSTADMFRR
jgi:hypothetical protein